MPKVNIIITLQVEGLHSWPDCDIKEVSFLKHPHRHIFHIVCKKEVNHLDRDIEIIQLKRTVTDYLNSMYGSEKLSGYISCNTLEFNNLSCEMIATDLFERFKLTYCSVLEDNENGAEITA